MRENLFISEKLKTLKTKLVFMFDIFNDFKVRKTK